MSVVIFCGESGISHIRKVLFESCGPHSIRQLVRVYWALLLKVGDTDFSFSSNKFYSIERFIHMTLWFLMNSCYTICGGKVCAARVAYNLYRYLILTGWKVRGWCFSNNILNTLLYFGREFAFVLMAYAAALATEFRCNFWIIACEFQCINIENAIVN